MLGQVRQLIALAVALGVGCTKGAESTRSTAVPDGGAFELSVTEAEGALTVSIAARGSYHLNAEYPHAFRPEAVDGGVRFARDRYELFAEPEQRTRCERAPNETCAARAKVPFEGSGPLRGTVAISVCNPDVCLIEKVPVSRVVQGEAAPKK